MLLTECCNAYDTFWGDLHVCRKCHMPNPTMIEVEYQRTNDAMDALSESMNPTLPELDSYEDGPIDGYDY
tara:strand:- start:124 stop:333 length:210 start_codon:yes stop_codon:yes gene_type:complete